MPKQMLRAIIEAIEKKGQRWVMVLWLTAAAALVVALVAIVIFGDYLGQFISLHDPGTIIITGILLALLAEYLDKSLGMGSGTALTPMLLLLGLSHGDVVPAVLVGGLVSGVFATMAHQSASNIDLSPGSRPVKLAVTLGVLGFVGALLAASISVRISESLMRTVTALIVIGMGVLIVMARHINLTFSWSRVGVLGVVAAANKGFMGGGYGPIITAGQVIGGISPDQAVAVTTAAEVMATIGGLFGFLIGGGAVLWPLAIGLILGGLLASLLAAVTVKILPADRLGIAVSGACIVLGLLMLLRLFVG